MFEAIGKFLDSILSGCLSIIVFIVVLCATLSLVAACPILIIILLLLGILCKVSKEK